MFRKSISVSNYNNTVNSRDKYERDSFILPQQVSYFNTQLCKLVFAIARIESMALNLVQLHMFTFLPGYRSRPRSRFPPETMQENRGRVRTTSLPLKEGVT